MMKRIPGFTRTTPTASRGPLSLPSKRSALLPARNYRDAPAVGRARAFAGEIERLSEGDFLAHFARDRGVVYPRLAPWKEEQMARADAVLAGRFDLVGEVHALGRRFSWTANPSRDIEWQIAHHKFVFAVDLAQTYRASGRIDYLDRWIDLIESWLDEMGSGFISASDAQVEAKRIEHWLLSFAALQGTDWHRRVPGRFLRRFLGRVAEETEYVTQNLRPARNHRTFQLYAVFLAGVLFPEFARHSRFVELGRDGLTENLLADFAADGVHVELSSHYHQITLETALAFVELARANKVALAPALLARLQRALEFSQWLAWPNGDMPLVNDSDAGEHRPLLCAGAALLEDPGLLWAGTQGRRGVPPKARSRRFADSGYFVFRDGWGEDPASYAERQHVFYDCGRLGEGSHSHYDLFNFTYFVAGEPLVVDPGRYTYHAEPDANGVDWRHEFKSTAYHNTVTIDGRNQTRYFSKARNPAAGLESYDRRRHPAKHGPAIEVGTPECFLGEASDWVYASARSYEYSPVHTRIFAYFRRQYLVIIDEVRAEDGKEHSADLRFHLARRWQGAVDLERSAAGFRAHGRGWQILCLGDGDLRAEVESGWVSTHYGIKHPAPVLSFRQRATGMMRFASVVCGARGLDITAVAAVADTAGALCGVRVDVSVEGRRHEDVVVFRPSGAAAYADAGLRYEGSVLLYRRRAGGDLAYLCASHSERLVLRPGAALPLNARMDSGALNASATTAWEAPGGLRA